MPQIWPMNWVLLFLTFISLFMFFIVLMYFFKCTIQLSPEDSNYTNTEKTSSCNWKW
ncbi:ATP synthase F0 subunit 8 (mitochondrion) [Daphnia carinata]|uniref:ATP synthase complex subunit 8 n=1 Tax=Daphnia carinata TaxID=120202 RepID=A0A0N7CGG7_9CRUS|nr:ATP synthase F0 subunit 8 [Daphnia carinata]AKL90608.1 ATPase subunit 8 [Daphnia carinata]